MLQLLVFMNLTGSMFFILHMFFVPLEKKYMPPLYRIYIHRLNLMCFIIPFPVCLFYIRRYFDTIVTELPVIPFIYSGAHITVHLEKNINFALPKLNYFQIVFLLLWITVMIYRYKCFSEENRKLRNFNNSHILFSKNEITQNSFNITELVQIAQKDLNLKKSPRIFLQKVVMIPHVSGVIHPTLCLPCHWNVSKQVYYMTIKHELAHVRHKDLLFQRIALIAGIINWFNPILFLLCKKMGDCEELAADTCACNGASNADRKAYQTAILELSFNQSTSPYLSVKGLKFKHKNFIKERILTMNNQNLYKHKSIKFIAATLISIITLLLSAIPALAYNLPSTLESETETELVTSVNMINVDDLSLNDTSSPVLVSLIPVKNDINLFMKDFDFSQSDYLCIDKNSTIYNGIIEAPIKPCNHNYYAVQIIHHNKNSKESCITTHYNGKICVKCKHIEVSSKLGSITYEQCPH